ncbi:hypothetical protein DID77_02250 [Candidatus Marinamargulisbacteria bacterium SCGC AG-439-L15]|nr:hypothetical protein DID77_02250 [Candidatus Marinamargulisbacteria bacterium SCGC AG-439-L15]
MKIKKISLFFFLTRVVIDIALIPVSLIFAYSIKFKLFWFSNLIFGVSYGKFYGHAQIEPYLNMIGVVILLWLISFYFVKLYQPSKGLFPSIDEFIKVVQGVSLGTLQVMAFTFVYKSFPGSRYVLIYTWVLGIIFISIGRCLILQLELYLYKRGIGVYRTVVIGGAGPGQEFTERMLMFPSYRYHYVGTLDDAPPVHINYNLRDQFKILGHLNSIESIAKKMTVDVVFLAKRDISKHYFYQLLAFCEQKKIHLKAISDLSYMAPLASSEAFDGIPIISTVEPWQFGLTFYKRVFDVIVSLLLLIAGIPIFVGVACWVKCVSPKGPVFYCQDRVGKEGAIFRIIKFRSMIQDAEKKGQPVMVNENGESRYILGGALLRKWSLDELPQLLNVLKGEMSLVGPRPERPYFVKKFSKDIPYYNERHKVQVGITGWAQVNGRSVLTHRPTEKLKFDLYYIKNRTFLMDIKILLKTIVIVLGRKEAY